MFKHDSSVARLLSPVFCLILLIAPFQDTLATSVATTDQTQNDQKQTGSSIVYGPKRISGPSVITKNKSKDFGVQGHSEIAPAGSFGNGKRVADLLLGSQNVTAHERQNCKKSHSSMVSKSWIVLPGEKTATKQPVEFENPYHSSVILLTLEWPDVVGNLAREVAIDLISPDGNIAFRMESGIPKGNGLVTVSLDDLSSLAELDYRSVADSLAQYDQLLIIDEDQQKLILIDWKPAIGKWKILPANSGSNAFTYKLSSYPMGSTTSSVSCEDCLSKLAGPSAFIIDVACDLVSQGTLIVAAIVICIASAKFWFLIPICLAAPNFIASYGSILSTIVCTLEQPEKDYLSEKLASWLCTFLGSCDDIFPPYVYLHSPNGGENYSAILNIVATVAGEESSIKFVEFDYSHNGGSKWYDVVGPGHSDGIKVFEGEGSILFDTKEAGIVYNNSMKVRVRAADTEGNISNWVETNGLFVVDNLDPNITSISITLNLDPDTTSPYAAVDAYGSAQYNTGGPVSAGTVTISHSADSWTARLDENGNYSRTITAPSSSEWVTASVADGNLTGQDQEYLTVTTDGTGAGYTFYRSTMCRDAQDFDPYDPIGETHWFRTNDVNVYSWVHLTDLSVPVQVRWYWYLPDGSQFQSPLTSDCTADPQGGVYDWWKLWYGWSVAGYNLAYYEGRHSVKIYAKECGEGYEYMESQYWVLAYDLSYHNMCKDVGPYPSDPIEPTNTFVTTDGRAITWAKFVDVSESIEVKWEYYEPSGALYDSFENTTDDPGPGSHFDWTKTWGWIWIDGYAATNKCGRWTVKVYEKDVSGNWDELYTDHFVIKEAVYQNPSVSVTLNTDPPLEGQNLSVTVGGFDNCTIESATLYWDTGTLDSSKWKAIYQPSFSQQASLGAFPASQSVEVYARMVDLSGNIGESQHLFITVVDTDTSGPEISSVMISDNAGNGNGRLEDCEQLHISFSVSDPSGIDSVTLMIDSTEVVLQGTYYSLIDPLESGQHTITILAIDGDQPPAANVLVDTFWIDSVPDAPSQIVSPAVNDTVRPDSVRFVWESVLTADSGYVIEVDTTSLFNSPELWTNTLRSIEDTSIVATLEVGTRYYWRLASRSYCGESSPSQPWTFTTQKVYSISGTVFYFDNDGVTRIPMNGEIVQLWWDSGGISQRDTSSASGFYIFSSVVRDNYWLKVDAHTDSVYRFTTSFFDSLPDTTVHIIGKNINFIGGPNGIPTDVQEVPSPELPEHYFLSQNYPNPFNPETRIEFSLPRASHVTIEIYNVLGKRVRKLVDEHLSVGKKVVTWNGKDEEGATVSSGIYFYRLVADGFHESRTMILLK